MNTDKRFWIGLAIFIVAIILICFLPYLFTSRSWLGLNFSNTGQIGDTIGGIIGTFIAIPAAILTFFAFWVQYQANIEQRNQFARELENQRSDAKKQEKLWRIERVENKFYSMLEMHRENINEININEVVKGREAFKHMFSELKFTYLVADNYYTNIYRRTFVDQEISPDIIYNIAYLIFFFGIGPNTSNITIDLIGEQHKGFFQCLEEVLQANQSNWQKEFSEGRPIAANRESTVFQMLLPYKPFQGHVSSLSHYIRHLFQTVKYIDDQPNDFLDYQQKYDYIASVRAQLSTDEQLIVYYNALSVLGQPWLSGDENYIERYCIIKSIPLPMADFYRLPLSFLHERNAQEKIMFEWLDLQNRMQ